MTLPPCTKEHAILSRPHVARYSSLYQGTYHAMTQCILMSVHKDTNKHTTAITILFLLTDGKNVNKEHIGGYLPCPRNIPGHPTRLT